MLFKLLCIMNVVIKDPKLSMKRKHKQIDSYFMKKVSCTLSNKDFTKQAIPAVELTLSDDNTEKDTAAQSHSSCDGITNDLGVTLKNKTNLKPEEIYTFLTSEVDVPILPTIRQNNRKFLKSWLKDPRFSGWLVYSQEDGGGGLCKYCATLKPKVSQGFVNVFVHKVCNNYKKFVECALKHRESRYHIDTVESGKQLIKSIRSERNIKTQLSSAYASTMEQNRQILTSIVKTVLLCAETNISLRGKTLTSGNFVRLLNFRIDAGDQFLQNHFDSMAGNAKYTSGQIQNEIINHAKNILIEQVVHEANDSYISIIADETTDVSQKNNWQWFLDT